MRRRRLVPGLTAVALLAVVACARSGQVVGSEGGPCYRNGTCDQGLVCSGSALCVAPGGGGSGACTAGSAELDLPGTTEVQVPLGCTAVRVQLWGAGGGAGGSSDGMTNYAPGAGGAYVEVTLASGGTLHLDIGGSGRAGYSTDADPSCSSATGAGGGGATSLRLGATLVAVAGGGGGGGGASDLAEGVAATGGTFGGDGQLGDGGPGASTAAAGPAGGGATGGYSNQASGGSGGRAVGGGGGGGGAPGGVGGTAGGCGGGSRGGQPGLSGQSWAAGAARFEAASGMQPGNRAESAGAGRGGDIDQDGAPGRAVITWGIPDASGGTCGNGLVELDEVCDDGNGSDGDGCSSTCEVEVQPGGVDTCAENALVRLVPITAGRLYARLHGDLTGSTASGVPTCVVNTADVVFEMQVPMDQSFTAAVTPVGAWDPSLTSHQGAANCLLPGAETGCADFDGVGRTEGLSFGTLATQTVWVFVGASGPAPGGAFDLEILLTP